jgi:uncharacterized protein (DUF1778 family)
MPNSAANESAGRGEIINLRASRKQKALIDRAAAVTGRSRSEFMLTSACHEAESVLLDRRYFALPDDAWQAFTTKLDQPPGHNPKLRHLLKTAAPWDR